MKSIIRSLFINSLVLFFAILIYPGIVFDNRLKTLVLAAVVITLLNRFVKPIIKLLLLPINLITLNLFGWVANVITLFILTLLISGFKVTSFHFGGFSYQGYVVPAMDITLIISFVFASLLISTLRTVIVWLLRS